MRPLIRVGRMGMLAVGLGIGAALAATPQIAAAGPSADPLAWVDQLVSGVTVPADAASPLDMQISISGIDLFSTVDNTATATSKFGDIAIAFGDGANATATGSFGDLAIANGTDSTASAGAGGLFDDAIAKGADSNAAAGLGGNFDLASADGTSSTAAAGLAGNFVIATAHGTDSSATAGEGSSFDLAAADGTSSTAAVGIGGGNDLAFADGTSSYADAGIGHHNLATAIGDASRAIAGVGNHDLAAAVDGGDASAGGLHTIAFADGVNSDATTEGIRDIAAIFNTGSLLDEATSGGNSTFPLAAHDIAVIIGTGSTAVAGSDLTGGGNWDLAAVFGDMLDAHATGANFLLDILPSL
jgi:hypothetical protein